MEYFIMKQNRKLEGPNPNGLELELPYHPIDIEEKPVMEVLFTDKDTKFIDYVESPRRLISNNLKTLLEKHDSKIIFRGINLSILEKHELHLYWLIQPPLLDCISNETVYKMGNKIDKLVLKKDIIKPYKIFRVDKIYENYLIVNLNIAETILRKEFTGIHFEKIQIK